MKTERFIEQELSLGVLAYGWTYQILDCDKVLQAVVPEAQEIESLGYSRFWITEHHVPRMAWSSPDTLVGIVAQATSTIRVGTAGILLTGYNPLKVATDFRCLATMFPGRIDLGFGSSPFAPNEFGFASKVMDPKERFDIFKQKVVDTIDLLNGKTMTSGPFKDCVAYPDVGEVPFVWILGTGGKSMDFARTLGKPYAHAVMFRSPPDTIEQKQKFCETLGDHPRNISVSVVCADTESDAKELFDNFLELGNFDDKNRNIWPPAIVGAPEQCYEAIKALSLDYGSTEVIVRALIPHPKERMKSFRLLADVFDLRRGAAFSQPPKQSRRKDRYRSGKTSKIS